MNSNKQVSNSKAHQPQPSYEDEISLVDIYLTIKRNSKLFFSVILLSIIISLIVTYFKYQANSSEKTDTKVTKHVTEYVLIIEVGRIFGVNAGQSYIDQPKNTLEKIKNIYIPKFNQAAITVEHIKDSDLIILKAIETSNEVNYNEILLTLAGYILKDHNSGLTLNNKYSVKSTKIIQQPTKRIVKNKNKNKILIPILGVIIGVFLGFFAVFIREFMKNVKEAETNRSE